MHQPVLFFKTLYFKSKYYIFFFCSDRSFTKLLALIPHTRPSPPLTQLVAIIKIFALANDEESCVIQWVVLEKENGFGDLPLVFLLARQHTTLLSFGFLIYKSFSKWSLFENFCGKTRNREVDKPKHPRIWTHVVWDTRRPTRGQTFTGPPYKEPNNKPLSHLEEWLIPGWLQESTWWDWYILLF